MKKYNKNIKHSSYIYVTSCCLFYRTVIHVWFCSSHFVIMHLKLNLNYFNIIMIFEHLFILIWQTWVGHVLNYNSTQPDYVMDGVR